MMEGNMEQGQNRSTEKLEIASKIKLLEKMRFALLRANTIRHELNELVEKNLGEELSEEDKQKQAQLTNEIIEADEAVRLVQVESTSVSLLKIDTLTAIDEEIQRLNKLL